MYAILPGLLIVGQDDLATSLELELVLMFQKVKEQTIDIAGCGCAATSSKGVTDLVGNVEI